MSWQKLAGASLVALGMIGFLTVADDLRHTGEVLGVGSILVAGVLLVGAGSKSPVLKQVALQWLALGILAGSAVGAGVDNMPAGIGLGAAAGAILMLVLGKRKRARDPRLTPDQE